MLHFGFAVSCALLCSPVTTPAVLPSGDGNRLAYLDELDPYYPSLTFPKLATPQWVGDDGVEAVIVLAIDDMRGHEKWEQFLRPILDRLKKIGGRAPVSIMTCTIDPQDPHLQRWLDEGLSLEVHTIDHPCPLLKDDDFAKAKSTYDRCVDLLASVPNNRPVAFRMPCCDSLNTLSPRFFSAIFNTPTDRGNFLQLDSSVFNIFTARDPALPRELVVDSDGRDKFTKYIPPGRSFVNTIENYPYPYVIGRNCWEFPCVTPSDWEGQNLHKSGNPITVSDLKAAIDATVIKQGVFNLVFHPYGWITPEQVAELIDHVDAKHGRKVKFLTFREAIDRLNQNLLGGFSLRASRDSKLGMGSFRGLNVLDLNNDGWMDVLVTPREPPFDDPWFTRLWDPSSGRWRDLKDSLPPDSSAKFGVIRPDGFASAIQTPNGERGGLVRSDTFVSFNGTRWVEDGRKTAAKDFWHGLEYVDDRPLRTWRLIDLDGDGICELLMDYGNHDAPVTHVLYKWNEQSQWWDRQELAKLPLLANTSIHDRSVRMLDINDDGRLDLLISAPTAFSVHLFGSVQRGWDRQVLSGTRGSRPAAQELPPFVREDGSNNGAWVHSRQLWWQNENTATMKDLVDRRSFGDLLGDDTPQAKSPEASLKSIRTRPEFKVELVAAEPLVMDPIAFAWGPDGKFWVVEMGDYPLGTDGHGKFGGRVRCLEDTDGDGRYDRSTIFLDELGFPTGVLPWRNGILVTCAPDIFYAEDTDGDGKADVQRTLFTGFGQGNQQHRSNGLVWGLDGWIYGANGDSGGLIRSVLKPDLEPVNISGRDFRIRPDEGLIDAVTGQTQFGRSCDDWGNWFGCNNSNPMYQFVLPDHYLRRNPHIPAPDPRVNVSAVPGSSPVYPVSRTLERFNDPNTANRFTSACSAMVYRDELFGPAFAGNSFVSEPVHNLIHREVMSPRGVAFTSRRASDEQTSEFLASSDNWFRPTTIKTGPDGSLWVADMYRQVIEHPEWIPKEWQERLDLRAGHDMGRIYRVFPADKGPRPIPNLDKLDIKQLIAAMDSPSGWQRDLVQMMLLWRHDPSAARELEALLEHTERPAVRVQALCTLDRLGSLGEATLVRSMQDSHPGVRRHAVRLAENRLSESRALGMAVRRLATDPDPQVRMQVAFSLGESRDSESPRALAAIARTDSADPFITAAVASSATEHAPEILAALLDPSERASDNTGPPVELAEKLISQIVAQGDEQLIGQALSAIARGPGGSKAATWQLRIISSLLESLTRRGKSLTDLRRTQDESLKSALARLSAWLDSARIVAADSKAALPERLAAVRLLGQENSRATDDLKTITRLLTPQTPGELQEAAVASAGRLRDPEVSDRLLSSWPTLGPRVRGAVLDVLLTRDSWTLALIDRMQDGRVPAGELDAVHRQRLVDHKSVALRDRAITLFGKPTEESRQTLIEDYRAFAKSPGDAQRGAAVFQKTCSVCHKVGNTGHEIGPDLSALANRSNEFFLTAILDPNRAVESRYVSYVAATHDGRIFTGMLAAETGNSVTLLAQEGKRETLLRSDIDSLQSTGKSLMPEGVERDIDQQAMVDLLAFLHGAGPPRKSFPGNTPEVVKPELLRHELYLLATTCEIYGSTLVFEDKYKNLGYWSSENDHAVWNFEIDRPGKYSITFDYACDDGAAGNSYIVEIGETQFTGSVTGTGNWDTYKQLRVGTTTFEVGAYRLLVRPAAAISGSLIDLRGIRITPAK